MKAQPGPNELQLMQDVLACSWLDHACARLFCTLILEDPSIIKTKRVLRAFSGVSRVKRRLMRLAQVGLIEFTEKRGAVGVKVQPRDAFDKWMKKRLKPGRLFLTHGEPS